MSNVTSLKTNIARASPDLSAWTWGQRRYPPGRSAPSTGKPAGNGEGGTPSPTATAKQTGKHGPRRSRQRWHT